MDGQVTATYDSVASSLSRTTMRITEDFLKKVSRNYLQGDYVVVKR